MDRANQGQINNESHKSGELEELEDQDNSIFQQKQNDIFQKLHPPGSPTPHEFYSKELVNEGLLINEEYKKSFKDRVMSPMQKGSLRGATFSLAASSIGAGALTLPKVFSFTGIALTLMLQVSVAAFTTYCM